MPADVSLATLLLVCSILIGVDRFDHSEFLKFLWVVGLIARCYVIGSGFGCQPIGQIRACSISQSAVAANVSTMTHSIS